MVIRMSREKDLTMCRHNTYQAPAKGQMTKATMLTTHSAKRVAHTTNAHTDNRSQGKLGNRVSLCREYAVLVPSKLSPKGERRQSQARPTIGS